MAQWIYQCRAINPTIASSPVAGHAECVVLYWEFQLGCVRIVAIKAIDPLVTHLTQAEGGPDVVFVLNLAVGIVQAILRW